MGPEGGSRGGLVVAEGTPEEVAAHPDSYTGDVPRAAPRGHEGAQGQAPAQDHGGGEGVADQEDSPRPASRPGRRPPRSGSRRYAPDVRLRAGTNSECSQDSSLRAPLLWSPGSPPIRHRATRGEPTMTAEPFDHPDAASADLSRRGVSAGSRSPAWRPRCSWPAAATPTRGRAVTGDSGGEQPAAGSELASDLRRTGRAAAWCSPSRRSWSPSRPTATSRRSRRCAPTRAASWPTCQTARSTAPATAASTTSRTARSRTGRRRQGLAEVADQVVDGGVDHPVLATAVGLSTWPTRRRTAQPRGRSRPRPGSTGSATRRAGSSTSARPRTSGRG